MGTAGDTASAETERSLSAARVQDLVILATTRWADHPDREKAFFLVSYGRELSDAERHALRCLTALDAVNCLAWGRTTATSRSQPGAGEPWTGS